MTENSTSTAKPQKRPAPVRRSVVNGASSHSSAQPNMQQEAQNQSRATSPSEAAAHAARKERERKLPFGIIVSWIALAATVACNVLFEMLKLGGTTAAEVSGQVFAWFTPAGYAFTIWAVIYLGLAAWLVSITRENGVRGQSFRLQTLLFTISCALNVAWLATFHFVHVGAALAIIIVLWGVLALLYSVEQRSRVPLVRRVPMSIYLGWISVATIANSANLITRTVEDIATLNEISTVAITVVVLLAGYAMARIANDRVFPLAIIWSTIAVGVHLLQVSPATATAVFAVTAVGTILTYVRIDAFSGKAPTAQKH